MKRSISHSHYKSIGFSWGSALIASSGNQAHAEYTSSRFYSLSSTKNRGMAKYSKIYKPFPGSYICYFYSLVFLGSHMAMPCFEGAGIHNYIIDLKGHPEIFSEQY